MGPDQAPPPLPEDAHLAMLEAEQSALKGSVLQSLLPAAGLSVGLLIGAMRIRKARARANIAHNWIGGTAETESGTSELADEGQETDGERAS